MTRKIKKERHVIQITAYQTTDNKLFYGIGAEEDSRLHQGFIDSEINIDDFNVFMKKLFNIKESPKAGEKNEDDFCNRLSDHVDTCVEDGFKTGISRLILDLHYFFGTKKWLAIDRFITNL